MADKQPESVGDEVKTTVVVAKGISPEESETVKPEVDLSGKPASEKPVEKTYSAKDYAGVQRTVTQLQQELQKAQAKLDEGGLTRAEIAALREAQASNTELLAALSEAVATIAGDEEAVKLLRDRQQKAIIKPDVDAIESELRAVGLSPDASFQKWLVEEGYTDGTHVNLKGIRKHLKEYITLVKPEKKEVTSAATEDKKEVPADDEPKLTPAQLKKLEAKIRKDYQRERGELEEETGGPSGRSASIPTDAKKLNDYIESLSIAEYKKLKPEIDRMRREGRIKT